jgi:hypothetical protein
MLKKLKHFISKFKYLKAFNSPFIKPKIKSYLGKINYGTPYFYPRRWIKNKEKPGYLTAVPKKIGFDFVGLGYKLKWTDTDYRFEWSPIISFVFFRWQFCILFEVPHTDHYWESWLYYENRTNKKQSKDERIKQTIIEFPLIYTCYGKGEDSEETKVNYYYSILKNRFHKHIKTTQKD